jgi:hypothetical protein
VIETEAVREVKKKVVFLELEGSHMSSDKRLCKAKELGNRRVI